MRERLKWEDAMGWVNYCKKCQQEVPAGAMCPHCGGKLPKTGERLSFWVRRVPVRDWFAWNNWLRVVLPVLGLVMATTVLLEGAIGGSHGIQTLFSEGFMGTLLGVLAGMLLVMLVLLWAQGEEVVVYYFDKNGVHAHTYGKEGLGIELYARFTTKAAAEALAKELPAFSGFRALRRTVIPWTDIRRVQFWREKQQVLFYRPSWWQALVVTCPPAEAEEVEAYIRKKLARSKGVTISPGKAKGPVK